jgi:class 3 adenylate cyclase
MFWSSCYRVDEPNQSLAEGWSLSIPGQEVRTLDMPSTERVDLKQGLQLKLTFVLSEEIKDLNDTFIFLGKPDMPLMAYLNGSRMYSRGIIGGQTYFVSSAYPSYFQVPSDLWTPGENVLVIHVPPTQSTNRLFYEPYISGGSEAWYIGNVIGFFNAHLFVLFFGVSVMGGLYFFFIWSNNKGRKAYLYFSISAFAISFYFFELGSPVPLFFSDLYRPFMKASLQVSIGALLLFFHEFFNIHNRRWIKVIIVSVFGVNALFIFLSPFPAAVMVRFTWALIPLQLGILWSIYILIRAMMLRYVDSFVIFAGTLIGVGLGTHDVMHQIAGSVPDVWLQGMGFFALQVSLFLALAMYSQRMQDQLEEYSGKLLHQKKHLSQMNEVFGRFVPQKFLELLGKKDLASLKLGDQVEKNMTVLFSDIRNFTGISEVLTPEENFNLLNSYLSHMAPLIREQGGIVDKYIGDAIMALFPETPLGAIATAQDMRSTLKAYNLGRERAGYKPLEIGVGIHTGSLMLGIVGENHRYDGTVISDVVNTASRLETLTKTYKVPILTSEETLQGRDEIKEKFPYRYLGKIPVKGRSVPLALYEILDQSEDEFECKLQSIPLFEASARSWEQKGLPDIQKVWEEYRGICPEDPVLNIYQFENIANKGIDPGKY